MNRNDSNDEQHVSALPGNKTLNQQILEDLGMKEKNQSTNSFSDIITNNAYAAIMKTEEDKDKQYSDLLFKYSRLTNKQMQDHSSFNEGTRIISPHTSPQKFCKKQPLSPSMKLALGLKLKDIQQRQLLKEQNAIFKGQNKTVIPRQSSYDRTSDCQDNLFVGITTVDQGLSEPKFKLQNELDSILPHNQAAKLSSVLEMKETYCETNVSPYIYQVTENPTKTSLRLLHEGVEENKGEMQTPEHETTSLIRFYSSEQAFYDPNRNKDNFDSINNDTSSGDTHNSQKNPQSSNPINLATNQTSCDKPIRSGGNLENFQRFATRNIKKQFHNHNNLSEQNSPYLDKSPSGKKIKIMNLGMPREHALIQNLSAKIDSQVEQTNDKRGRSIEEKYAKNQNNGLTREGHSNSELDIIQERRKIQMEEPSQLQQTASSQNEQPNITAQSDTILPSYRQPKSLSNFFWNLQRLHVFVKESKNYSLTEQNKIDHGKMILTYQESFSDQTFFKSLTLMYFQQLFIKEPQLGKSPQLTLFDLLNFVNNNQIILHSVPLKDIQGDQLKEIFIKNVNELTNLRSTLSCEALFEKFLQLFTQDPIFCEALIQVTKQSVALTCESRFKDQASSFLQIASQNWFDIKTEFFPLLSNAFNSVIEMHYLLDNQIEISTFQSLRAQNAQPLTLSFVYYYNQALKKQFFSPLFSLEDSLIFGALSSFFRRSPSSNFLSQLTQNSALSKSESLKRLSDTTNQIEMKECQQQGNIIPQSIQNNNIQFIQNNLREAPEIIQLTIESPFINQVETQDKIDENCQEKQESSAPKYQDTYIKINQTQNQQQQLIELNYQYSQLKSASPLNAQDLGQRDTTENQYPSPIYSQKVADISPSNYCQKENFSAVQQEKEDEKELVTIVSPPVRIYQNLEQIPQHQFNSSFLFSKIHLLMQICKENTENIEKTLQFQDDKVLQPGSPVINNSQQERKPQHYLNLANLTNVQANNNPQTNVENNDIEHRNRGNSAPRVQHFSPPVLSGAPPNRTGSPPPTFKSKQQHQLFEQSSNSKNLPSILTTPAKWQTQYQRFEDAVVSPKYQKDLISQKQYNPIQGQNGINRIGSMQNNLNTAPQFKKNYPQSNMKQNTQNQIGYNLFGNITSTNQYPLQKHPSLLQFQHPLSNNFNAQSVPQQPNTQIINPQLPPNKAQIVNPSIVVSESKQMVQQFGYQQQQQYLGSQSQKNLFVRKNY